MLEHTNPKEIIHCVPPRDKRFQSLIEMRFAKLLVLSFAGKKVVGGRSYYFWRCLCDCGKIRCVMAGNLRSSQTKSCGCLIKINAPTWKRHLGQRRLTHGMSNSTEYRSWSGMKSRCNNPKRTQWKHYGGRGIKVCERWELFENFLADMGAKPSQCHSIERCNNEDGYHPGNCRWATRAEQMLNRSNNRRLTFHGETMCYAEWERKLGLTKGTISLKIKKGYPIERVLTNSSR